MLINHRLEQLRQVNVAGRAVVFVTPTKELVNQQVAYIRRHFEDPSYNVQGYTGDSMSVLSTHIDNWDVREWTRQRLSNHVLVMTPEIMRNLLHKKNIPMEEIDTLVADECHHVSGKHPMALIFKYFKENSLTDSSMSTRKVKVLGLTATPKKTKKVRMCSVRIFSLHVDLVACCIFRAKFMCM
jgi:endoribonuclease Dicer